MRSAFAERLAAYEEVKPAGYKFLGEYRRDGQSPEYRDFVIAISDQKIAEAEANAFLQGAAKITMITLSNADLAAMKLKDGQVRK